MTRVKYAAGCGGAVEAKILALKVRSLLQSSALLSGLTFSSAVLFSPSSRGQLALIIYEWKDAKYIGIDADGSGASENQWEDEVSLSWTLLNAAALTKLSSVSMSVIWLLIKAIYVRWSSWVPSSSILRKM